MTLMLREPERLRALLLDHDRPVQLVVAGKSHPADENGKALIQQIVRFADAADVRHRIVFLPDFDMSLAPYLYAGADVWLNNPTRPLEACGTSGMKAALNGVLNCSIRDGWWDELFDGANGWAIPTAEGVTDSGRRDDLEAAALYDLLASQVAPLFYERDEGGVPTRWLAMVRHTLATLGPRVQAGRMLREYVEDYYAPAATSVSDAQANGFAGARELSAYRARLEEAWPKVAVTDAEIHPDGERASVLGTEVTVWATVELAGLSPESVSVEAVLGRVDDADELHDVATTPMRGQGDGHYSATLPLTAAGTLGYTVRVLPRHYLLAAPVELGRVVLAG
jgi:starch phosphorylase